MGDDVSSEEQLQNISIRRVGFYVFDHKYIFCWQVKSEGNENQIFCKNDVAYQSKNGN